MGLFDKKVCDICGKEIKFLGNRKLDDGNMCKDCAAKLSPWFTGRKRTSVDAIKEQLKYREENQKKLASFNPTRIVGDHYKFYIDEPNRCFVVSYLNTKWKEANPDLIRFSDVRNMSVEIEEDEDELYTKDSEGKSVSYNPPRYEYEYDFKFHIDVNHPYFDDMDFTLNAMSNKPENPGDARYMELVDICREVFRIILGREFYDNRTEFKNPVCGNVQTTVSTGEWFCPKCGTKNSDAFCVKCGTPRPASANFEPYYCSKCGTKIESPDDVFCPKCGNKLK
ncbi:MAG: DUF4428 domain-containing protein [Erysipelotrichaceae bacterium]|nr:DUF4428 domain-containing protein [Erysipelotrichaceae bacterium]